MENKIIAFFVFLTGILCLGAAFMPKSQEIQEKKYQNPEVVYYRNEDFITKAEVDINCDGKPDIICNAEDGKFKSAEVDTNYDGKPDKKFTDPVQFKQWVNDNNPEVSESLDWEKWSKTMDKVFWKPGAKN